MDEELAAAYAALTKEFADSGKDIDSFIAEKLATLGALDKDAAERLLATFSAIDENYADLRKKRTDGKNRREWLGDKLEEAIVDSGAGKMRDEVGVLLADAAQSINNCPQLPHQPFDGIDAVDIVNAIDREILAKTSAELAGGKETSK